MKSIIKGFSKAIFTLLCLAILIGLPLQASAQGAEAPQFSKFYPAQDNANPQEFRPNTQGYAYFTTKNVLSAKAHVVQNGATLGDIIYDDLKGTARDYQVMDYGRNGNAAVMEQLTPGLFTLSFFEIIYLDADQNEQKVTGSPLAEVTYRSPMPNGYVVSQTGFEDLQMISYYPAGSEGGVKTFTFNKPVKPDNIKGYFEYAGSFNMANEISVPTSLSADGLTLTVDLRGHCYNVATMAPGQKFKDDEGNPTDPPAVISLVIDHLDCVDGSKINWTYESLDGKFTHELTKGQIFLNWHYTDITFPTPECAAVEFYPASNPADTYAGITPETNMMALTVNNLDNLVSADILLTTPRDNETIAFANIDRRGNVWHCALPASIIKTGSDNLVITLINAVYDTDDGAEHIVRPLDMARLVREVRSIADLRKLDENTHVLVRVPDGIKVTLSRNGYNFIEDETGGVQVITEDGKEAFPENSTIKGYITGYYQGYDTFLFAEEESEYALQPAEFTTGVVIDNPAMLADGVYDNRLVTLVASAENPITYDSKQKTFAFGNITGVTELFDEPFDGVEEAGNITGVFYNLGNGLLLMRGPEDIDQTIYSGGSIAQIKAQGSGPFEMDLEDVYITFDVPNGWNIMEDRTGGLQVIDMYRGFFLGAGKKFSGHLVGTYEANGGYVLVDTEKSDLTVVDEPLAYGKFVTPEAAQLPEYYYRLLSFKNTEEEPFQIEDEAIYIGGDKVCVTDFFEICDDPYGIEMPQNVGRVTGIVIPMNNIGGMADDDLWEPERPKTAILAIRTMDDLELAMPEVSTVAELKAVGEGTVARLTTTALTATFATEAIAIAEDTTGGIALASVASKSSDLDYADNSLDEALWVEAGTALSGELCGVYTEAFGFPAFIAYRDRSSVKTRTADVARGASVPVAELSQADNNLRLVTFEKSDDVELENVGANCIAITESDATVYSVDFFEILPDDYECPALVESVTGIVFTVEEDTYVVFRSTDDIVALTLKYDNIAELNAAESSVEGVLLSVDAAKITFSNEVGTFLEDATGALMLYGADYKTGDALTGTLYGNYMKFGAEGFFVIDEEASDVTVGTADVTFGANLTEAEAAEAANAYRLATFTATDDLPIRLVNDEGFGSMVVIGNSILVVDLFDVLPEDYKYPDNIAKVTGIIFPASAMMGNDDDEMEETEYTFLVVRSAADIVAGSSAIDAINVIGTQADQDIYDLRGIRVRRAGESLDGLTPGLYLRAGQKILVK